MSGNISEPTESSSLIADKMWSPVSSPLLATLAMFVQQEDMRVHGPPFPWLDILLGVLKTDVYAPVKGFLSGQADTLKCNFQDLFSF